MMPVVLLTEGFLGNGSEPWKIPSMSDYPQINPPIIKSKSYEGPYKPFVRDSETLARTWAFPGTEGLEHRVGGLEKNNDGVISSDPIVHERMVGERAEKVDRMKNYIPEQEVLGAQEGDILMVSWGGTYGHMLSALKELQQEGKRVGLAHFDYIFPLPKNTADIFGRFKKIIICELNSGQFADFLKAKHQNFHYNQCNKVQGQPFIVKDIVDAVNKLF